MRGRHSKAGVRTRSQLARIASEEISSVVEKARGSASRLATDAAVWQQGIDHKSGCNQGAVGLREGYERQDRRSAPLDFNPLPLKHPLSQQQASAYLTPLGAGYEVRWPSDKELHSAFAVSGSFEPASPEKTSRVNSSWLVGKQEVIQKR